MYPDGTKISKVIHDESYDTSLWYPGEPCMKTKKPNVALMLQRGSRKTHEGFIASNASVSLQAMCMKEIK